ncbi:MAG: TRAP transporter large permease [Acetomicrobium flavidum]|uniref:TRAP transporter large permease n=1 Tax=Acetomicrobium flavidum TaxID=49896 RepID=UPI0016B6BEA3|nr:TRAP transporter large permease [Acetomicrobium flavidum]
MLILLAVLFVALIAGIPVAFSIAISSAAYLILFSGVPLLAIAQRMVVGVDSFTLLAIPLFLLAGELMARGDITPRIVKFTATLVGHIPGGMAMVMAISCMFFGAISGSGVADVVAIGSILLPAMNEQGYKKPFSATLLGCSGALATIIPPSIVMVVIGVTTGASIGKLFLGGFIPGIMAGVGFMIISYIYAIKEKYPRMERASWKERWIAFKMALLPLLAPAIILGGILLGVFTATEAGGIAALYALILAIFVYKKVSLSELFEIGISVVRTSAVILFIISAANLFGWVVAAEDIPQKVATFMLSISENYWVILILFNILLLLLGMFMETIAIIIIVLPIFLPIFNMLGVDLIHLGLMVCVNLAIGANTPPLGVDLIAACRISGVRYESTFRYLTPFLGVMVLVLALITAFPQLVLLIPNILIN